MAAGYSGTPLARKLGIKPGSRVVTVNAPENYPQLLAPLPEGVTFPERLPAAAKFIHLFAHQRSLLEEQLPLLESILEADGMLWVSWPKKASKVATDVDENIVRQLGLAQGLVDVKICAVDAVWSGLKFVYRLKDRPKKGPPGGKNR